MEASAAFILFSGRAPLPASLPPAQPLPAQPPVPSTPAEQTPEGMLQIFEQYVQYYQQRAGQQQLTAEEAQLCNYVIQSRDYLRQYLAQVQTVQTPIREEIVAVFNPELPPDTRPPADQTWTIARLAAERPPQTWELVCQEALPDLRHLSSQIDRQTGAMYNYFPPVPLVFGAMEGLPINGVRVVFVGQDPYYQMASDGLPVATGMAFSIRRGQPLNKAIQHIYQNMERTVAGFRRPTHGDLTRWKKQGVLLLNASLTVEPNNPNSHAKKWNGFLIRLFRHLAQASPKAIFLILGRESERLFMPIIDIVSKANIITGPHPTAREPVLSEFLNGDWFNEVNRRLKRNGLPPIDWNVD